MTVAGEFIPSRLFNEDRRAGSPWINASLA